VRRCEATGGNLDIEIDLSFGIVLEARIFARLVAKLSCKVRSNALYIAIKVPMFIENACDRFEP